MGQGGCAQANATTGHAPFFIVIAACLTGPRRFALFSVCTGLGRLTIISVFFQYS
jgi:hypothetical protein